MVVSAEEDGLKESATMTDTSAENREYRTCLRDRIQQWRRWGIDDRPEESMTTTEASVEEDEHKYYNNENGSVDGG